MQQVVIKSIQKDQLADYKLEIKFKSITLQILQLRLYMLKVKLSGFLGCSSKIYMKKKTLLKLKTKH